MGCEQDEVLRLPTLLTPCSAVEHHGGVSGANKWGGAVSHPGGNPGANLKSMSHRCHPILVAFVWESIKDTINLPLGCLQGGCEQDEGDGTDDVLCQIVQ